MSNLEPPKYLIIVVNRFRSTNSFTQDRCSIPMGMTVALGLHKFSLQATIDHQGPSMYSGNYTAPINCCKKKTIATTAKIRGLKWLIPKTPLMLMWKCIKGLHNAFRTRPGGWEFWLLPWRWHVLSITCRWFGLASWLTMSVNVVCMGIFNTCKHFTIKDAAFAIQRIFSWLKLKVN